jgi:membrane-associated protein
MHFDLQQIIITVGYLGVWAIIFAESGLFFGFFLPGDSLLFTAGFLASPAARRIWESVGGPDAAGFNIVVLARFLPAVRTFAPIVAGVGEMPYPRFLFFNLTGGALWTFGLTVGGYFLGSVIPDPDRYLLPIIVVIIVLSILPTAIHLWREHRGSRV